MPKLTVRLPGLPPVTHALTGTVITVGRTPENTVQIADPSVSKAHARLEVINGDYHVVDLESRNGTFVNNQRVRNALVRHSDLIRFAGVETIFETDALEDDSAAIAATAVTRPLSAAIVAASKVPTPRGPLPAAPAGPGWAKPAGAAPVAAGPAVASAPKPSFMPKAPAAAARKGLPNWAVLTIGIVLAFAAAGGVWWWLSRSSAADTTSVEPAAATATTPVSTPPVTAADTAPKSAEMKPEPAPDSIVNRPISAVDVPAIGTMLRDKSPEARRQAARALHALGKDSIGAVKEIRDAVKDTDPETRLWAALSLAQLDATDQASVPVLLEGLKNENPVVRQVSALSLSVIRFQGDESTPVIEVLLKLSVEDQDEDVRKAAASASKLLSATASLR
jgi:hypothetical protein